MLPENLAITVIDVLNYHQKHEKVFMPARTYSAISLRLKTAGKYLCKGKTITLCYIFIRNQIFLTNGNIGTVRVF